MTACPHCKSTDLVTVPGPFPPPNPHFARLECGACGRLARWLPRPAPTTIPEVPMPAAPALLRGTPGQVGFAETIRAAMARKARVAGLRSTLSVILSVRDATWFLANKDRPLDGLRWPTPGQLADGAEADDA